MVTGDDQITIVGANIVGTSAWYVACGTGRLSRVRAGRLRILDVCSPFTCSAVIKVSTSVFPSKEKGRQIPINMP